MRSAIVLYGPLVFVTLATSAALFNGRAWFPSWYRQQIKKWCIHLLRMLSIRIVCDSESEENLRKCEHEICIATHQSHLDSIVLWAIYPSEKNLRFVAKEALFRVPLLGIGLKAAGAIAIDRSRGREALSALRLAVSALDEKDAVVIFPEGTRTSGVGVGPLKKGAFILAKETGRSLLPVAIQGSADLYPRGALIPRTGVISVFCMEPIQVSESVTAEDMLEDAREKLHTKMGGDGSSAVVAISN